MCLLEHFFILPMGHQKLKDKTMKQYIKLLLLLFISCDKVDDRLKITNTSIGTLCVFIDKDSLGTQWKNYLQEPYYIDDAGNKKLKYFDFLFPKDTNSFTILGYWDREENFDKNGNLYVFVIDSIDIGKHSNIRRYKTSLEQLRRNGWLIEVE